MVARAYPAALLLMVGLALFAARAAAGKPAIEARVDAIERRFEAELQQAEERLRIELRNELTYELAEMKGELKRLGGRLNRCESATATSSEPGMHDSGGQKVDLELDTREPFGEPSASSMPEAASQTEKPAAGTVPATMAQQVAELTANMTRIDKFWAEPSRQRQLQAEDQCDVLAVNSMLTVCCSVGGTDGSGHRRQLQGGCSSFPPNCSPTCAVQFVPLYEGCPSFRDQIAGVGGEVFFASCNEAAAQAAAMNRMQPLEVRMYRISVSSSPEAAGNQAGMFLPDGGSTDPTISPIIGPLPELPTPGDGHGGSSADVEQFHAQCTTANVLTCVPACNMTTHGYELLATIDGTDTKFSCSISNLLFSWVGAAALGGFLGSNAVAFVSAVISGAAGTYMLTLVEGANVVVDLVIQPGQHVIITGDSSMSEAPLWGSAGFEVRELASLSLEHISLEKLSVIGQAVGQRGELSLQGMILPAGIFFNIISSLMAGGVISMNRVHLTEKPELGALTGSVSSTGDMLQFEPVDLLAGSSGPHFHVNGGNCVAYGQCVGRPVGYLPNEHCDIVVVGQWPRLAPCRIFDTDGGGDAVAFTSGCNAGTGNTPGSCTFSGSSCPAGVALVNGDHISWDSSAIYQGGDWDGADVHSVANGGLPRSTGEAGGGWAICLVPEAPGSGGR